MAMITLTDSALNHGPDSCASQTGKTVRKTTGQEKKLLRQSIDMSKLLGAEAQLGERKYILLDLLDA